jgi:hypothetical protein
MSRDSPQVVPLAAPRSFCFGRGESIDTKEKDEGRSAKDEGLKDSRTKVVGHDFQRSSHSIDRQGVESRRARAKTAEFEPITAIDCVRLFGSTDPHPPTATF